MSDHWQIDRPTILAVSGGRTSMHMLWRYLDRHDGRLPGHAVPVFCNTGKEHPLTLDFVHRCSIEWGVRIVWLEYAEAEKPADRWREVSHNSASREGEPFAALIRRKSFVPNQVTRFCTTEMKVHLTHRWARAEWRWGSERYVKAVGFRADEGHRRTRALVRCGKGKDPWDLAFPLYDAGIDKAAVLDWWARQPFDLGIPERLGNCDLCFLKSRHKLAQNIEEKPERADWWIAQEIAIADLGSLARAAGRMMHNDSDRSRSLFRPSKHRLASYRDLRTWALSDAPKPWKQGELDFLDLECSCTD